MNPPITNIKNILLVEDDPRDAELTLAALEEHRLANRVEIAKDGAEALDYLYCRGGYANRRNGNPIVILLDNKMPKVSGIEVLKTVKADPILKLIPVVVLTSSREAPDLAEFYQSGANAYVVKPVGYEEFMRAVGQLGVFWTSLNELPPDSDLAASGFRGVLSDRQPPVS